MILYQCVLLGAFSAEQAEQFTTTFRASVDLLGLQIDRDYTVSRGIPDDFSDKTTSAAVFFGAEGADFPEANRLKLAGVPVIPVVSAAKRVSIELPASLRSINALFADPKDTSLQRVVSVALRCLGLLPEQRRVFVSYRREESADVALQLYEALSARNFDVFLDTHSVSAAVDFQEALWHRLCDSDVLVMLDTAKYFSSRWTTAEWGKAIARGISMLQLVWPGRNPERQSGLATVNRLVAENFSGSKLTAETVDSIALEVERVRSVSVALRHNNLVGTLRTAVQDLGGSFEGVGQRRSVVLKMPSGKLLVAYPIVGVPTSVDVQNCADLGGTEAAAVVYDHVGISSSWTDHMGWLATKVAGVKWLKRREADWLLADLEV